MTRSTFNGTLKNILHLSFRTVNFYPFRMTPMTGTPFNNTY